LTTIQFDLGDRPAALDKSGFATGILILISDHRLRKTITDLKSLERKCFASRSRFAFYDYLAAVFELYVRLRRTSCTRCEKCSHTIIAYNSCRNRHCPKCQSVAAREWLAEREAELLPVPYYHVVFTLPARIADIAYQNKAVIYDLLFKASSETMLTIAADPKHLGARIGILSVLHTWGSAMTHHPHVHMIVPGGGFSLDGRRWVSCRPRFFLSVEVLSALFRGLFLDKLSAAYRAGELQFFGKHARLIDPRAFAAYLKPLRDSKWVVYCKRPFGGPKEVLRYLARYTHRVAISNRRLIACDKASPSNGRTTGSKGASATNA
jgi:hypothetical protein